MIPKTKDEVKGYPAKYSVLEEGDIIQYGDEYYNPFMDQWERLNEDDEGIGDEWSSDHYNPMRRKFEESITNKYIHSIGISHEEAFKALDDFLLDCEWITSDEREDIMERLVLVKEEK